MPTVPPISIAIISQNEEVNLRRCLASAVGLAREIVVVDSGSTDRTAEVAQEFGARFVTQPWLGFTDQKNLCNSLCSEPWILALDCDEEISPELRASILRFFESGEAERFQAAWMARRVWFMGRWICHGDWYPDKKVRLFQRDKSRWEGHASSQVHEKIVVEGTCTTLAGDLLHYSFKDMRHYLIKQTGYSDVFVENERKSGRGWSWIDALFRPWWRFVRAYFFKAGFLDGFPGFWIAVSTAFFAFIKHSRKYEIMTAREGPPSST